ncbi:predicted protein [Sparassis crispa]|uniref:Protein BIG1 n=1 Tax=Sparassis crispa TaxID=139825 RepID=A0A401G9W0_9APHY|nr:predicted protein [Sparassis crispa]GBE78948.1 predicted protein [Sparassis crispa]
MHLISLALLPVAALAFSDTHPLLIWSSVSSPSLAFDSSKGSDFAKNLLKAPDICSHDAVVFINQVDLHAADLHTLSPSSGLVNTLESAFASFQFPYVRRTGGVNPFEKLADELALRCGARLIHTSIDEDDMPMPAHGDAKEKHVVCMGMPSLEGVHGATRKSMMAKHESQLSSALATLARTHPHYLVLYSGWSRSNLARQSSSPNPFDSSNSTAANALPSGGILARYQLLTPALLLALILTLGVLVPLVLFGVYALAGVQSPVRNDPPKQWISAEKKNQ